MADASDLLETLEDQLEDLSKSLAPLLNTPIQDSATKLPVVDKARLYVLATYALESLLFSYLRLNDVNAKEHPIMRELTRIRGYVGKINNAEATTKREGLALDKEAAGRFIKYALAGNEKYDAERAETQARERANAQRKFEELEKKVAARAQDEIMEDQAQQKEMGEIDGEKATILVISDSEEEENGKDTNEEKILEVNNGGEEGSGKDKNKEQVERIISTFKSYGVGAKEEEMTELEAKAERKRSRKEKREREKEEEDGGKRKKSKKEKRKDRKEDKAEKGAFFATVLGDKSSKNEKKKLKT
ncbi:hypothetical protein RUND412_009210 [Rhizina undulata]